MSRSAESRKLLREMHQQRKQQVYYQTQTQTAYPAYQHPGRYAGYGAPPPPPPFPPPLSGLGASSSTSASTTQHVKVAPTEKTAIVPMNPNINATYNLNTMLFQNIEDSDYYKALKGTLNEFSEVVQEIKLRVSHVEPWQAGTSRVPSSAFCLLLKLLTMRLTYKQLRLLITAYGFPYVRALGFLYLRYSCIPTHLYKWCEPFLEDKEEFQAAHSTGGTGNTTTISAFLKGVLSDMQFFGTTLPRIPTSLERKIKVLLLLLEEKLKRREANCELRDSNRDPFVTGSSIKAIFVDSDTEPAWYFATIESREEGSESKYWVTFEGYDSQVRVDIGDIGLLAAGEAAARELGEEVAIEGGAVVGAGAGINRKRRREGAGPGLGIGGAQDVEVENLMAQVLEASRDASHAIGKNYSKRIGSVKNALSMKQDTFRSGAKEAQTDGK